MSYRIVRFFQERHKEREIIYTGLTLEEAKKHCNDPNTWGPGWFDGYERED